MKAPSPPTSNQLPLLLSTSPLFSPASPQGTAFVTHSKKWNGLTPSCDNIYGFCLYAAFLQQHPHYHHVMKASVDTYFQADPFAAVNLRGGLAIFLSYPYSRELRWDAFTAWTYNATTMHHHDPFDEVRCGGQDGCLKQRVGVLCQMFMGTAESMVAFMLHTVMLFELNGFHSNLRRCARHRHKSQSRLYPPTLLRLIPSHMCTASTMAVASSVALPCYAGASTP